KSKTAPLRSFPPDLPSAGELARIKAFRPTGLKFPPALRSQAESSDSFLPLTHVSARAHVGGEYLLNILLTRRSLPSSLWILKRTFPGREHMNDCRPERTGLNFRSRF